MNELREVARFFRCSLDEAVQLATDRCVMRYLFEWWSERLFFKASPW